MHWYVAATHANTYGAALIGYTLATWCVQNTFLLAPDTELAVVL